MTMSSKVSEEIVNDSVRQVSIPRERLPRWLSGFETRHGATASELGDSELILTAEDGAMAWLRAPLGTVGEGSDPRTTFVDHVMTERRVGAILARKGGFAVGIFDGRRLVASKVGSSYVQGKTKAGGWSQQRYARRRDNQSKKAYADAADEVAKILMPEIGSLQAVVTGGDNGAIAAVLADHRLEPLQPFVQPRLHPVADPRLRVLQAFPDQFLAIQIRLNAQA